MSLTARHTSCRYPLDLSGESLRQGVESDSTPTQQATLHLTLQGVRLLKAPQNDFFAATGQRGVSDLWSIPRGIWWLLCAILTGVSSLLSRVPLMPAHQIKRLDIEEVIGFHTGFYPFRARRLDWRRFPHLRQRREQPLPPMPSLPPAVALPPVRPPAGGLHTPATPDSWELRFPQRSYPLLRL